MLFNSHVFLFVFLPLVVVGYYALVRVERSGLARAWLVLCSLFFYGWWNPAYLILLIFSLAFNFGASWRTRRSPRRTRRRRGTEIIEGGYLYIAQPPLYRAKKGSSQKYLKDDREMETYLIEGGVKDSLLTLADGVQISAQDLVDHVRHALQAKHLMEPLIRRVGSA